MDSPPKTPPSSGCASGSSMTDLLGLLRVKIIRGINLAVRDVLSSDPYVVIKMGNQRFKTHVINGDVNPEWNEELTLSILDPTLPIQLIVYDHDMFSKDDKMGEAEFDIKPFTDALKMNPDPLPTGTLVTTVVPCRQNCLSEASRIFWSDSEIVQDICLRLKHVECGEVELQLQWIDLPGCKGL